MSVEVAPLRNPVNCLIPPEFSELASMKMSLPTKIRVNREVSEFPWAVEVIPMFADEPNDMVQQTLHAKDIARLIPIRVPQNPYVKLPRSTNKDTFRYKVVNAETQ